MSVSDMIASDASLDTYISQLANAQLKAVIDKYSNEITAKAKEYKTMSIYMPPQTFPMKEIDYLILGADSREKIVNYIYRGMIRDPPTNSAEAMSYTFYYIDEFTNLHSVIYNNLEAKEANPRKITHNLTCCPSSALTKLRSQTAISFIKKWTMELAGEILYNKDMYFANNDTAAAYAALEDGTIDGKLIAKLRYCQRVGSLQRNIEEIPVPNSTLQINSIDLIHRMLCDINNIANNVYYASLFTREDNNDHRRRLCFIEAAQAGLNKSRREIDDKYEELIRRNELADKLIEFEHERIKNAVNTFANSLTTREASLKADQLALNDSRDRFDIHVAVTQRDLDKIAAEKAQEATLAASLALAEHKASIEDYSNQVFVNTKAREESLLAREMRLSTKAIAVDAAQAALNTARSEFDAKVEHKTKELKAHEEIVVKDTHRLYSREYELDLQEEDLDAAKNEFICREYVLDKREQSLIEREQAFVEREQSFANHQSESYMQKHDNDNTRDMLYEWQEEVADKQSDLCKQEAALNEREQALNTREQALDARDDVLHEIECSVNTRVSCLDNQEILLAEQSVALETLNDDLNNKSRALNDKASMLNLYESAFNRDKAAFIAREDAFKIKYEAHATMMRNVSKELNSIINPFPTASACANDDEE